MLGGEDVAAVVVELGHANTKVGFAGSDSPAHIYPALASVVEISNANNNANNNDNNNNNNNTHKKYFTGANSYSIFREGAEMRHAFDSNNNVDWDVVEALWECAFKTMRVDPREHPVLHAEPMTTTKAIRERLVSTMFELKEVPAFFLAREAVLSCFAAGREKGLVIDCGATSTVACCVHDGFALRKSIKTSPLAGNMISRAIVDVAKAKNVALRPRYMIKRTETTPGEFAVEQLELQATSSYHNVMQRELADDIKQALCRVSEEPWSNINNQNVQAQSYELPDGNKLELDTQRFTLAETLFVRGDGVTAWSDADNTIQGVAWRSVDDVDVDVRRDMFANMIITGGTSLLPGFSERTVTELREQCAEQMYKLKPVAAGFAQERRFSTWIGGSILASLGTFQQLWISKQEYDEYGASLVHKKCP